MLYPLIKFINIIRQAETAFDLQVFTGHKALLGTREHNETASHYLTHIVLDCGA